MNPSASGWVKKFSYVTQKHPVLLCDHMALYKELEQMGFIYGASVKLPKYIIPEYHPSLDERTKINLLFGLFQTYRIEIANHDFSDFFHKINSFYQVLNIVKTSFFEGFVSKLSPEETVEKIIDQRVFPTANFLFKSWGKEAINPYLYLDLLCFKRYLQQPEDFKNSLRHFESLALEITQHTLITFPETKKKQENFLSATLGLKKINEEKNKAENKALSLEEKLFFLNLGAIIGLPYLNENTIYLAFLEANCEKLSLEKNNAKEIIEKISDFVHHYKKEIPALKKLNLGEQLYEHLNILANKLILRNSKRLLKELKGSKELVVLLSKSTHKELNELEKKKIQEQLLDIFKSIPSLAIFILPGGAILLPIFIKLIPKLLPTAFDDNRIEE